MNRLEKIKKRLDEAYYEGYELVDDISYLVESLAIAEEALAEKADLPYKDFYSSAEQCLTKDEFKRVLDFMTLRKML